jgi:hypothetical protein
MRALHYVTGRSFAFSGLLSVPMAKVLTGILQRQENSEVDVIRVLTK